MKAIEGALGALMRDKIEQSKHYDVTGIPRCLLLRSKLMLEAKETIYLVNPNPPQKNLKI